MQLPRCLELTSLLFALSSEGNNPEAQRSGSGTNAIDESRKQDFNRLKSQKENSFVVRKNDNLDNLLSEDEIYCFKEGLFRCLNDKILSNLRHLTPEYYRNSDNAAFTTIPIKCPRCRKVLNDQIDEFKNKFIKYFIINPQKDFFDTFEVVLTTTNITKITQGINLIKNEVSDSNLKFLLDFLYPDTRVVTQNFKKDICKAALYSNKNKISPEIIDNFISEIRTNCDSVLEVLSKHLDFIRLFSGYHRSHLFDSLLESNFSDPKTKSDAIFYLFERFSECKLFWNLNKSTKIELSMFALKAKTAEGLKLFAALNYTPFLDTINDENKISKLLYSLFAKFGHNRIFFQAIKNFNHSLIDKNSRLGFFINYATPEMILTADYEFLREHFDEDFIFDILVRYFKNEKTAQKAMNYFFENVVFRTGNPFKLIGEFFWTLNKESRISHLQYCDVLEIFLSIVNCLDNSTIHLMIEAYKSYKEKYGYSISRNFSRLCSRFSISKSLQEPFKKILGDI